MSMEHSQARKKRRRSDEMIKGDKGAAAVEITFSASSFSQMTHRLVLETAGSFLLSKKWRRVKINL
jgi:hypothetical protein